MLQHILGRHSSWALVMFLVVGSAVGCGDDSSEDNDNENAGKGGSSSGGRGGSANGGNGGSSNGGGSDELLGTGDDCSSYQAAEGDQCAGWYCGVTEAQLTAAVDATAKCGGDVALLCKGSVVKEVAWCARDRKGAMPTATNDELRPMVRQCVYDRDAEIKEKVPEDCLDCTIDAAACAADNCLLECITGDSERCDTCRRTNNCDQQVFSCGGLPAPIE